MGWDIQFLDQKLLKQLLLFTRQNVTSKLVQGSARKLRISQGEFDCNPMTFLSYQLNFQFHYQFSFYSTSLLKWLLVAILDALIIHPLLTMIP